MTEPPARYEEPKSFLERIHEAYVFPRRIRVLRDRLAPLLPLGARVLDVGCGDGRIAASLLRLRPDLSILGLDVLVRPHTEIPVEVFDGRGLPFATRSFDSVLLIDVLHHAEDPAALLKEAARVGREVLVKDHQLVGRWAGLTLRLMDRVGNARHGVALRYSYLTPEQWSDQFRSAGLEVDLWNERLNLYPRIFRKLFDRSLHFLARLRLPR